jgi:hypothetical protein
MSFVTVTHAAKLAGVSRQYLYKAYINTGKISVERDLSGAPLIETSELIRVFGVLEGKFQETQEGDNNLHEMTQESAVDIKVLEVELAAKDEVIRRLERQIAEGGEREVWLRQQLERAQAVLTDQRTTEKHRWWQFWG